MNLRQIELMRRCMMGDRDEIIIDPEGDFFELSKQFGFTENKEEIKETFKQGDGYYVYIKM